jgi:hypothetical protein
MRIATLGDVVAVRELELSQGKTAKPVRVIIGKPLPFPDSSGYYCPFQITGAGSEEIKYAAGIDAVQALQGVMVLIAADLEFQNEKLGGKLHWEGDSRGGFGFPKV